MRSRPASVYTPLVLWGYDLVVLGFSNRFVWRCRSSRMLERYNRHVGARHLDVGVGTGWFLDHCTWPVEKPQITLLDMNENSLSAASKRNPSARAEPQIAKAERRVSGRGLTTRRH